MIKPAGQASGQGCEGPVLSLFQGSPLVFVADPTTPEGSSEGQVKLIKDRETGVLIDEHQWGWSCVGSLYARAKLKDRANSAGIRIAVFDSIMVIPIGVKDQNWHALGFISREIHGAISNEW